MTIGKGIHNESRLFKNVAGVMKKKHEVDGRGRGNERTDERKREN